MLDIASMYFQNALFFLFLIVLSAFLTYLCRRYIRIMDYANERSSHTGAIPRSGGIAIVSAFCMGILIYYVMRDKYFIGLKPFWGLFFSSLMIAVISLYDDITNKAFIYKLISQLIGVAILIFFGLTIRTLTIPYYGNIELGLWGYPITLLWMVGITNAFNFMDGINGLTAGVTVIVGLAFTVITYRLGVGFVFHVCYMLAAVTLGFLIFNFPKGTIFMGDVGSTFIGFCFGAFAILAANFDCSHTPFMVLPILVATFVMETLFTFIWRMFRGDDVLKAHRLHPYQLLKQLGVPDVRVALIYYLLTVLSIIFCAVYLSSPSDIIKCFILFVMISLYTLYFWIIHKKAAHILSNVSFNKEQQK